jgi:hypothetical protein
MTHSYRGRRLNVDATAADVVMLSSGQPSAPLDICVARVDAACLILVAMTRTLVRIGIVLLVCRPAVGLAQTTELSPFVGYRFGGGFFERVTNQPVDLDGAPVIGGVLNVAMHDGLWFEGLFTHQQAQVDVPGGPLSPPTRWHITVDHWFAGGLQDFAAYGKATPFVTGLLGLTRYAAAGDNEIRFSIGAGGGVKLRPTRHLGARLDGRVFTTFADVNGHALVCSPGLCLVALHADLVWQAEFSAGLVVAF